MLSSTDGMAGIRTGYVGSISGDRALDAGVSESLPPLPSSAPAASPQGAALAGDAVPQLEVRVFGGFDIWLDGVPIDSSYARQRKIQALVSILAIHHGRTLYSDYVADSIWPRSTPAKQRHCFYNLWYLATHAVYDGDREDNPYFERRQLTCRLLDDHVRTDVEEAELACADLMRRDLSPAQALEAYRRLQASYRGDLLPGETDNAIIIRARQDWRERVSGALSAAAQSMVDAGDDRTALWLATVACRVQAMREDVVRMRMELFAKMGMQAYAVKAYNELEDLLHDQVGLSPSPQSVLLMEQVAGGAGVPFASAARPASPRRRGAQRRREAERQRKADYPFGDALPVQVGASVRPV